MGNPEHRDQGVLWAGFQKILHPGSLAKEPLFQGFVFRKLNFTGNPPQSPGTLCTWCIETELYVWVFFNAGNF